MCLLLKISGRGSVPQSDIISILRKHSGNGDAITSHNICPSILTASRFLLLTPSTDSSSYAPSLLLFLVEVLWLLLIFLQMEGLFANLEVRFHSA